MLSLQASQPVTPIVLSTLLVGTLIYLAIKRLALYRSQQAFKRLHGCTSVRNLYKIRDPILGLDMAYAMLKAARAKRLLDWCSETHRTFGDTYMVSTMRLTTIFTVEAENLKAAFADKFHDWSVAPARQAFKSLLGDSIFMSDGAEWSHSRGILRPIFTKSNIADLELLEKHFQQLLTILPADGSTVNLAGLFTQYAFDVSTEFLFGESIGCLSDQTPEKSQLTRDIDLCIYDTADQARYSWLYPLLRRKGVDQALQRNNKVTDRYVSAAIARAAVDSTLSESKEDAAAKYSFLDELARLTTDPKRMRDESITLMFAGKDTSATLLGTLWFLLARHPAVWKKLLAEVDQLEGELPTYEWIKNAKYLRNCEHEAMRLYPVTPILPPRTANKDTILPLGGGEDGKSPIFVAKGTKIVVNINHINRQKEIYGEDADEFNPDRWDGLRPGWHYTPFSGGSRICIGQQFALTEIYYLTIRLMQHFRRIECRDPEPFIENFVGVTFSSGNGVQVGLYPE